MPKLTKFKKKPEINPPNYKTNRRIFGSVQKYGENNGPGRGFYNFRIYNLSRIIFQYFLIINNINIIFILSKY